MVAVPVLLGSLMRIPLGWLTDRLGGRRVFTALMAFTPLPLIALALLHDSLGAILAFGFLLGFAGASFAVGVPFVNGWYPPERQGFALGIYGMGMGGTVLAGLTAPRIADHWGLVRAVLGRHRPHGRDVRRLPRARARRAATAADRSGARHVRRRSRCSAPAAARGRSRSSTSWPSAASSRCSSTCPSCSPACTTSPRPTPARAPPASRCSPSSAGPLGGWLSDRVGAARVLLVSFIAVAVLALAARRHLHRRWCRSRSPA